MTVIFVAIHLGETFHYWPATLSILLLAILALLARLKTGSVVRSMAVHAGYNGIIVAFSYLGSIPLGPQ